MTTIGQIRVELQQLREELQSFRLQCFQLTPAQEARLDRLTDAKITAAAESDLDNPPLTGEELRKMRRVDGR